MAPVLALIAVIPFGDVLDLHSITTFVCSGGGGHPLAVDHGRCLDAAGKVVAGIEPVRIWPAIAALRHACPSPRGRSR